jgi:hypothetical protein
MPCVLRNESSWFLFNECNAGVLRMSVADIVEMAAGKKLPRDRKFVTLFVHVVQRKSGPEEYDGPRLDSVTPSSPSSLSSAYMGANGFERSYYMEFRRLVHLKDVSLPLA